MALKIHPYFNNLLVKRHPELLRADLFPERRERVRPLSLAAGLGQEAVCSNLLLLGEDVNEQDKYLYTPLQRTILPDKTNVATLLLQHGANPNIRDFKNLTALDFAKKYNASSNMIAILSAAANR